MFADVELFSFESCAPRRCVCSSLYAKQNVNVNVNVNAHFRLLISPPYSEHLAACAAE